MDKEYTITFTESQVRLLISGLNWMDGESGGTVEMNELEESLRKLVGPTQWERQQMMQEQDHDGSFGHDGYTSADWNQSLKSYED